MFFFNFFLVHYISSRTFWDFNYLSATWITAISYLQNSVGFCFLRVVDLSHLSLSPSCRTMRFRSSTFLTAGQGTHGVVWTCRAGRHPVRRVRPGKPPRVFETTGKQPWFGRGFPGSVGNALPGSGKVFCINSGEFNVNVILISSAKPLQSLSFHFNSPKMTIYTNFGHVHRKCSWFDQADLAKRRHLLMFNLFSYTSLTPVPPWKWLRERTASDRNGAQVTE